MPAVIDSMASATSASVNVRFSGEDEPERQAALIVGERAPAVAVEQDDGAQQRPPCRVMASETLRGGPRIDHDDGEVAPHPGGVTACRPGVDELAAGEASDRELPDDDPPGSEVQGVDDGRVQFADPTRDHATAGDPRRPTRMQVGILVDRLEPGCRGAETSGDELHEAFRIVEVVRTRDPVPGRCLGITGEREPEPPPLVRPAARRVARPVALADLEDRDVGAPVPQVGRDDLQQAAEQTLAKHRVLSRERIRHGHRSATRPAPARRGAPSSRHGIARPSPVRRGRTSPSR
jgi:hypothetical protein